MTTTHDVKNQVPPLEPYNAYEMDAALHEAAPPGTALGRELWGFGQFIGSPYVAGLAFNANRYTPVLRTHDRFGNRIDEVDFHPSYDSLMEISTGAGLHGTAWTSSKNNAHVERAMKFYLMSQVEAGHGCPISMTYAAIPALRTTPALAELVERRFAQTDYEPWLKWIGDKEAALCGMGMTEKQGGSDVRANETRAVFAETTVYGDAYLLTGHKWFCSAPMCDVFLVTAQTEAGPTCFFMPRVLPDGARNAFYIQRLKDKLGNRSNASSEVEFDDAYAFIVGEPGRGIATIAQMVNSTRLDCIIGSAGLMRAALAQALHHAAHRQTFGKRLIEHPLMQNVLADLALESEAATLLFLRLAQATDRGETALKRLGTALGKYWVCKRAPAAIGEALEVLGGNGYVEESVLPRLYREAPVNSIWEGSGNINALDVLRILRKEPEALDALTVEIGNGALSNDDVWKIEPDERDARAFVERLVVLWQAALMQAHTPVAVAEAFIQSRVGRQHGFTFGTLPRGVDLTAILERAWTYERRIA